VREVSELILVYTLTCCLAMGNTWKCVEIILLENVASGEQMQITGIKTIQKNVEHRHAKLLLNID